MAGVTSALQGRFSITPEVDVGMILDDDYGADIDDEWALYYALLLQQAGRARLLAVTTPLYAYSQNGQKVGPMLDIILREFGSTETLLGACFSPDAYGAKNGEYGAASYVRAVTDASPSSLGNTTNLPSAVSVWRRVLASQPSNSVDIIIAGQLRNLRDVFESGGDTNSPLGGADLIAAGARQIVVVAGNFPFTTGTTSGEHSNFDLEPSTAWVVTNDFKVPVVFCGVEVGAVIGPVGLNATRTWPAADAIQRMVAWYFSIGATSTYIIPPFAQMGIWYSVFGTNYQGQQALSHTPGKVNLTLINNTNLFPYTSHKMASSWTTNQSGTQKFLQLTLPPSFYKSQINGVYDARYPANPAPPLSESWAEEPSSAPDAAEAPFDFVARRRLLWR